MTAMLEYNEEVARRVEAIYTTADVIEQRRQVIQQLQLHPGERVIDVGVGPGFLAQQIAQAVGAGGHVVGVDTSADMLTLAQSRSRSETGAIVELAAGSAIDIPQSDAAFDAAVSTQVLEYVADIEAALREIRRVLRPDGRVLLLDTDWDSVVWHSTDDVRMARVLQAWAEHLAHAHLPRRLAPLLEDCGFTDIDVTALPLLNVGYRPDTYSAGLLELIARFVVGRAGVIVEEADAWARDLRSLGRRYFFSINRYVFRAAASG